MDGVPLVAEAQDDGQEAVVDAAAAPAPALTHAEALAPPVTAPAPAPPARVPPASASPRKPLGIRHRGARPQSNRFLKETLAKLSDDSARVGRKFVEDGYGTPSYGRLPGLPMPDGLREEMPLALPEQAEFLLPRFLGQATSGEVFGAAAMDGGHADNLPAEYDVAEVRNAMLAVAHVISTWSQDISGAAGKWAKHMDDMYLRYSANNDRWDALKDQVVSVQAQLERLDGRLSERFEATETFRGGWHGFSTRVEGNLQSLSDSIAKVSKQSDDQTASMNQVVTEHSAQVTESIRRMIFGSESDPSVPAMEPQLQAIQKGLQKLVDFSREDIGHWHSTADRLQSAHETSVLEVELARKKVSDVEDDAEKLRREVAALSEQLRDTSTQLKEARHASAGATFETLKSIEKRGRIRVNRQSGLIEAVNGLDFAAVKVGQATADWKDPDVAVEALNDLAEIAELFEGPMLAEVRLRPGKGGKPEFWDKVAQVQAEFLKDELRRVGVPEMSLLFQGQQAAKNQEPGVFLTLKRDVFDDAAVAALAGGGGGDAKKPGKK